MTKPLSGIRVLDLGRFYAAPWCTQLLADLGADVIKIERPGVGDEFRLYVPPYLRDSDGRDSDISGQFYATNRNKRSVTVDIGKPEGQEIVRAIAATCDVVIENFKAGDLARYGLDHDSLKRIKPDLVYCSITGFGQSGPYAARPGFDSVFQAMSGLMSVTGEPDGPPQKVGLIVMDLVGGLYATISILSALRHREVNKGPGQHIDLALLDTAIAAMSPRAIEYLATGDVPQRLGSKTAGATLAQFFRTSDGYINLQASADEPFRSLCRILGAPALSEDPRFLTQPDRTKNQAAMVAALEPLFLAKTTSEWYEALIKARIVSAPIYTVDQTFADPHVRQRGVAFEVNHPRLGKAPMIANPIRFSETPVDQYRPAPDLGEHTAAVLQEVLGYDANRITGLKERGVL